MKNLFTILVLLISFSCSQECQEPTNVWFKLSNDTSSKDYGETIPIDMSKGFASTDGSYIYLVNNGYNDWGTYPSGHVHILEIPEAGNVSYLSNISPRNCFSENFKTTFLRLSLESAE